MVLGDSGAVRRSLSLARHNQGSVVAAGGGAAPLYLGYSGNLPLQIQSPFTGTIVAPDALLQLEPIQGTYDGEFFAMQIQVQANVISGPFSCVVH
jgi:hypothetical protein